MHVSADVITGVMDITKKYFGELVVSIRKKNTFIGMEIELVKYGKNKYWHGELYKGINQNICIRRVKRSNITGDK